MVGGILPGYLLGLIVKSPAYHSGTHVWPHILHSSPSLETPSLHSHPSRLLGHNRRPFRSSSSFTGPGERNSAGSSEAFCRSRRSFGCITGPSGCVTTACSGTCLGVDSGLQCQGSGAGQWHPQEVHSRGRHKDDYFFWEGTLDFCRSVTKLDGKTKILTVSSLFRSTAHPVGARVRLVQ